MGKYPTASFLLTINNFLFQDQSEDCLYLNIYTPTNSAFAKGKKKIHQILKCTFCDVVAYKIQSKLFKGAKKKFDRACARNAAAANE